MIKDLIKDLTYDNIDLNQGLMRAKLIAYEINNDDFKSWIMTELNGYSDNAKLPEYRIIPCDIFAIVEGYGMKNMVPFDLTDLDKGIKGKLYKMEIRQSIATLEEGLQNRGDEQYGYEDLPIGLVALLRDMTDNRFISSVKRRIQLSQPAHIVNLTKQKLVDTLLELNKAFPDLSDNYHNTKENQALANTIINNHIYGENASSNVGIGENITQNISNVYNQKVEKLLKDIEELGVPKEDVNDVKEILTTEKDKSNLGKKLINWVGKMTTKAVEKSIDLEIPLLIDKVQEFL